MDGQMSLFELDEPVRDPRTRRIKRKQIAGKFKKELEAEHGTLCANCGTNISVQWHHIVPLVNGGKDIPENMIPLCTKCHAATHGFKKAYTGRVGRAPKTTIEAAEPIFKAYVNGEIDRITAAKKLGYSEKVHITDTVLFKRWWEDTGQIKHGNFGRSKDGGNSNYRREQYRKQLDGARIKPLDEDDGEALAEMENAFRANRLEIVREKRKAQPVTSAPREPRPAKRTPKKKIVKEASHAGSETQQEPKEWGKARLYFYWKRLTVGISRVDLKLIMGDDITADMIGEWEDGKQEPTEEQRTRLRRALRGGNG